MRKVICTIWALITIALFATAQKATFQFYNTSDGLASNRVWSIAQDQQGFIWVNSGYLNRFDGYQFLNGNDHNIPIFNDFIDAADIHNIDGQLVFLQDQNLVEFNTFNGEKKYINSTV